MTFATLGEPVQWPIELYARSLSTVTANAAGEGIGTVLICPVGGSLTKITARVTTVSVAGNLTARVETVDPSTGLNTGTLVAAGAEVTQAAVANSWNEFTLTTPPTVAAGDVVALVVKTVSTTSVLFQYATGSAWGVTNPYRIENTAGTWSKAAALPTVRMMIDGVWVHIPGAWNQSTIYTAITVGPATTPDEVGNLFTMPATMRSVGARFYMNAMQGDDVLVRLYGPGDVLEASVQLDGDLISSAGEGHVYVEWPAVTMGVGEEWRLVMAPNGAGTVSCHYLDTDALAFLPGDGSVQWTQRTNGGAWSQTSTRFAVSTLLIDGFLTP